MIAKTLDEIVLLIKKGHPKWYDNAVEEHKRLNTHINGHDTADYLTQIDNIENKEQLALRKKALTTNRHLFANLGRPIDKVFSANGGSNIYNVDGDKLVRLRKSLNNLRHGKSIRNWIKDIQSNKYYTDPAGLVFFEWNTIKTWPTLKSIKSIYSYESDGRTLEYVIFNPTKLVVDGKETDKKVYRFVDNAFDYSILQEGEAYSIIEDEKYINPFGTVPAIINSDKINYKLEYSESPFEVIISLADHYLRTGSIKNLNEFLHGYPVFWRYLTSCKTCKGTGYIEGKTCQHCLGSGYNLKKDVTDIIQLEVPEKDTDIKIAPDVAGYVTPPVESLVEMRTEMDWLTSLMELTLWGSKMAKDASNTTATAAFLNVQPVNDRLNDFADAYEDLEKKMVDLIGTFLFKKYDGASIHYGRRFLVESPDVIWKKYQEAKTGGAPKITLDYLLIQYFQSEYSNDLQRLSISQKGIRLEPFVHKTDEEIQKLDVTKEDKKAKYYFNEWFKNLTEEEILTNDVKQLNALFDSYLQTKIISNEIP